MTVQRIDSWPEGMPRTTVKRLDGREAGENWVCYLGGGRFYDVHADRYWKDMTVAHPLWGEDVEAITCRDLLDEIAFMDSYTLSRVAEHLRFVCADGVVEYDDDTEVMAIVESGLPRPESLLPKPPVAEPDSVDADLDGRMKRYGVFAGQAKISQSLKIAMWEAPSWHLLPEDMREALEMVQHKVARILNGDPQYADNWHDIAGYARLVERRILKNEKGGVQ